MPEKPEMNKELEKDIKKMEKKLENIKSEIYNNIILKYQNEIHEYTKERMYEIRDDIEKINEKLKNCWFMSEREKNLWEELQEEKHENNRLEGEISDLIDRIDRKD